jgi:sec-independent protein translocase protein TatB
MFGMGMPEILLILAIALVVIGPKKLPDLAKSLGRALGEFRRATNDLKSSLDADGDLKEVKDTFDGMRNDIRSAMTVDPQDLYPTEEPASTAETDGPSQDTAPDGTPSSPNQSSDTTEVDINSPVDASTEASETLSEKDRDGRRG